MRVIFFGTSEFAVPSLERLVEDRHDVVLCVTQPDRPQGRGLALAPSPVKAAALRLGVRLAQPERPERSVVEPTAPDVGVVAAYGALIPKALLTLPRHGMVGVHPSLLPKYRGAAPVAWAILRGETKTGVTIFRLDDRLDAGDLLVQRMAPVAPSDTTDSLTRQLSRLGADALAEALSQLADLRARPQPQDETQATQAPKFTKAQGRIDWRAPAEELERLIRAMTPWPGAAAAWHGDAVKILAAAAASGGMRPGEPGTVLQAEGDVLTVATGRGALQIRELQPAGKRRMSAREFLAGPKVRPGDRLE